MTLPLTELDGAHFIGIGGVGMSALALVLRARGLRVSGSDAREGDTTRRLRQMGVRVEIGHAAAHLGDARRVVVSSAIHDDNPELRAARERGLPLIHRSQALASLMAAGRSVGVAGCHGKTTTTLMTGAALTAAGLDPTVLVGGWVNEYGGGARIGARDLIVAEVDESDGSFLNIRPDLAIVTNIDFDHPDHFRDLGHVSDEFVQYLNQLPDGATVIADGDDTRCRAIAPRVGRPIVWCQFGDEGAEVAGRILETAPGGGSLFEARLGGAVPFRVLLGVGGRHRAAR